MSTARNQQNFLRNYLLKNLGFISMKKLDTNLEILGYIDT